METKQLTALIILDGFGMRKEVYGNAVAQAKKPNFERYWNTYATSQLVASGEAVGLPSGQMGNSEVGHLNIGAGRIVHQTLTRINKSIEERNFFKKTAFIKAMEHAKKYNKALHLIGLLSDGGVHSHLDHLFALLQLAKNMKLEEVYVHALLDGRDVGPKTAEHYLEVTKEKMEKIGIGQIATVSGRYYAMDRDQRWERTKKAYDALVYGKGAHYGQPEDAVRASYKNGVYDEFVLPSIITGVDNEPLTTIQEQDAVIFYNFRPDRAIQLSLALTAED